MAHSPAAVWTRSAWPVFCTGSGSDRWVRIGFAGQASYGPSGRSARAIVTVWPRSVPPSASSRYQWSPIL